MRPNQGSRRPSLPMIALAALLLAACGRSSGSTSSGGGSPSGTALSVQTDAVSGIGTVLANSGGLTLYHNTKESESTIVCTGGCVSVWPPVLVSGSLPQDTGMIKGTFGTIMRPDGSAQLTINGMPLYTYSGDSASGQANIQGVWFAVTPSGTSTSTGGNGGSAGGGGGYG